MCDRVGGHEFDNHGKEDSALCVITAVTGVEVFMNVYFRILITEKHYEHAKTKIMNDLERQISLDKKVKEWPEAAFNKRLNFGSGIGQQFIALKNIRNGLIHFSSTYETLEAPGFTIQGLADTSMYDSLNEYSAYRALETAEHFICEIFKLRGINDDEISGALHTWTGLHPMFKG
ncbi:MAG: hypothetical protein VST71_13095 [Nitrospirota bacterium]|nr:hypothetical protein [Nitrospirota bacterium]